MFKAYLNLIRIWTITFLIIFLSISIKVYFTLASGFSSALVKIFLTILSLFGLSAVLIFPIFAMVWSKKSLRKHITPIEKIGKFNPETLIFVTTIIAFSLIFSLF